MKYEIAMRWAAALRSGEYRQGSGFLHQFDGSMCCLGVLCHLKAIEDGTGNQPPTERNVHDRYYRYDGDGHMLPHTVREWAGMESVDGDLQGRRDVLREHISRPNPFSLTEANDHGYSFAEIADCIERHYELL